MVVAGFVCAVIAVWRFGVPWVANLARPNLDSLSKREIVQHLLKRLRDDKLEAEEEANAVAALDRLIEPQPPKS